MSFKSFLIRAIDWALPDPGQPVKEAAFREAYGQTIDADEDQWRKLSGDAQRDLTPWTQSRMQKIAHYLWEQNLLANRLIELPVAFLLAEGVRLTVKDEENQKVLDRFWYDAINEMDIKLPKKVRELALFGEQCYPAFVNDQNGMVRIGYLDPSLIETVVMDPDNPEQPIGVVTVKNRKGIARRYRVIINGEEEVFTERTQQIRNGFADGDAFFFRVNDLSSGTRGRSDLLAQADWLDAYDQFMFGELDRQVMMRAFIWDVTLSNATEEQVTARAKKITAPKPGSVRVHNDSEKWEAEAPDLKSYDSAAAARLFRNQVLGGATIPEHWFGGGGDVNRAVGAEMETPTLKIYTMRQKAIKYMLESIGRYVLWRAAKVDTKQPDWADQKWKVQAEFPELSEKDLSKQSTAISQIAAAAASLITQKIITRGFALQLVAIVAKKLGVEIDAEKELAAAQKEAEDDAAKQRERDNFNAPPGDEESQRQDAAMQEALALIRDVAEHTEQRFAELERLSSEGPEERSARFTEALHASQVETAKSIGALTEALCARIEKSNGQITAMHEQLASALAKLGPRKREITLPDGRKFKLTEEVTP